MREKFMRRRVGVAIVFMMSVFAVAGLGAPSFTDQGWDAGYVNPGDEVVVQKIKVTDGGSVLDSLSIRNLGTADENIIKKIVIDDDANPFANPLSELNDLTGIRSGLHFPFNYQLPTGTSYLWIGVEIADADAVSGGETIQLQVRFYSGTYTSPYIVDGAPEEVYKGGFETLEDKSPTTSYLNPGDADVLVQDSIFSDDDGNESPVSVTKVLVKNAGSADNNDVPLVKVEVSGKVDGEDKEFTAQKVPTAADWGAGEPLEFSAADFGAGWPPDFDDDSSVEVKVLVTIGGTEDKHDIQTIVTLKSEENGQTYDQTVRASTDHVIRVQGFEEATDVSDQVASGVKSPGEYLLQKIKLTDDDVNDFGVTAIGIWVKNLGTATAADISRLIVKRLDTGTTLLSTAAVQDFGTGHYYPFTTACNVPDDHSITLGIYYQIAQGVTAGRTLQPRVYIRGRENGNDYDSDRVSYPESIALYPPGLETVANVTPPEGGTAYSGERVLAQKIRCVDMDENDDPVMINPIVVKNIAANPCTADEVTKIEIRTEDGDLLGEETDLDALLSGGVAISTLEHNVVPDDHEVVLCVYVTFAAPEDVTAGHKLKLETTLFYEEDGHTGHKGVEGPEWTLAINHRPQVDFSWSPQHPKWSDDITFTPQATDPDNDSLVRFEWDFGDGSDHVVKDSPDTVTHNYPNGGTFTVTLTVTDERGLSGTKSKQISVEERPNQPPTADFDWQPPHPEAGQTVTFTADASDPDGDTPLTYAWDFGDGDTLAASADNDEVTHTFATAGTYTVTLTVTDARGAETQVQHDVVVEEAVNDPPAISALALDPQSPQAGEEVTFTATAEDPEGDEITDWQWDFDGDGRVDTTTHANTAAHTYQEAGFYTVKVRAKDGEGSGTFGPWFSKEIYVRGQGAAAIGARLTANPVDREARIEFIAPPGATELRLRVFDLLGRLVYDSTQPAGSAFRWDLTDGNGQLVPDGLYFALITATWNGKPIRSQVLKILVLR